MKLKKFFKPLVTVSALSMLLMGCAEDSSNGNGGGDSTAPQTAETVFMDFLAGFQSAPAQNATALEFTTNTATKQTLKVAQGEEVQYLVSLDNVMATYYATFGITGTSTLLTGEGSDLSSSSLSKITHYAKVDKGSDTASIDLTLNNGTNSLYTGMFALMSQENVEALDTALGELDKEIEAAKPTEGEVTTPDLTKIQAAAVQKVVDLINGNMYKVAYNSPAQSVQTAFAAAQPLTLKNGMAFTEGDGGSTFEIAAGKLSYEDANPAIADNKVVVFLDEFKNKLNGVTDSSKDTVKSEGALTTNTSLGITTDTVSSNVNTKKITYTPAAEVVAGAKVTYIAILDATTNIDSADSKLGALNKVIVSGANKEQVEAALAELGTIYKIDYSVGTYQSLIDAFKASEAVKAAVAGATKLESLTYTDLAVDYDNTKYLYCLYETGSIKLSTFGGNDLSSTDVITGYVNGGAGKNSSATKEIVFTDATSAGTYYAYCTNVGGEEYTPTGTTIYEKLADFLGKLTATEDGLGLQVFSHEKAD